MTEEIKIKREGFDFWREDLKGAKYVVAPMVDQSELPWRLLSRRYGAELCYTPMFHSSVFVRDQIYRKEAMTFCSEDRPLIVQFCANDPDTLLKAAKMVEDHCDAIDLNIGCPQSIARRGHYGSFLQDEWDLLHRMVSLCAKELKVPITCKIRIFEDVDKTVRYAKMLEEAGAQLITVHGRTRDQKGIHTGIADWKYIAAVRQNVKIPVFANGNIQNLSDVHNCIEATGVEGVMSAEGNLHDPAIFTGQRFHVCRMALEYLELVEKYPCPTSFVRGHIFKLLQHALAKFPEHREAMASCKTVGGFREVVMKVEELCRADVEIYESQNLTPTNENIPYWLCQPYVRPEPVPMEKSNSKRSHPSLNEQNNDSTTTTDCPCLVENEAKKFKNTTTNNNNINNKINNKNRNTRSKRHFEVCPCGQPKGLKCSFEMCKTCCKPVAFKSLTDCLGHKLFVKKENRKMWKEQVSMEVLMLNASEDLKSKECGDNNDVRGDDNNASGDI